MRQPERFDWKFLPVMIGAIAGFALAIWIEPTQGYPYRMIWAVSGMAVGSLIYWVLKRRNSN